MEAQTLQRVQGGGKGYPGAQRCSPATHCPAGSCPHSSFSPTPLPSTASPLPLPLCRECSMATLAHPGSFGGACSLLQGLAQSLPHPVVQGCPPGLHSSLRCSRLHLQTSPHSPTGAGVKAAPPSCPGSSLGAVELDYRAALMLIHSRVQLFENTTNIPHPCFCCS